MVRAQDVAMVVVMAVTVLWVEGWTAEGEEERDRVAMGEEQLLVQCKKV